MVIGVYQIPLYRSIRGNGLSYVRSEKPQFWPFVVGPENYLLEFVLQRFVATSPDSSRQDGPFVLYGESGVGKSHLALGLASAWLDEPGRESTKGLITSALDWNRLIHDSIKENRLAAWRDECREYDLFVLDDVHLLTTHQYAQQQLITLLDDLDDGGIPVMITSTHHPRRHHGLLPGLVSRLGGGLTIPLLKPGNSTRENIAKRLAGKAGWKISDSAAKQLAKNVSGTVPQLAANLANCAVRSKANQTHIDTDLMDGCLEYSEPHSVITITKIAKAVARYHEVPVPRMVSPTRKRSTVHARAVAVYLARRLLGETFDRIGQFFGGRDHSTILHAYNRIRLQMENEPDIAAAISEIEQTLVDDSRQQPRRIQPRRTQSTRKIS